MYQILKKNSEKAKYFVLFTLIITISLLLAVVLKNDEEIKNKEVSVTFHQKDLVSIKVMKGTASMLPAYKQIHAVDGITGATVTSNGLTDFLLTDLIRYEGFLRR